MSRTLCGRNSHLLSAEMPAVVASWYIMFYARHTHTDSRPQIRQLVITVTSVWVVLESNRGALLAKSCCKLRSSPATIMPFGLARTKEMPISAMNMRSMKRLTIHSPSTDVGDSRNPTSNGVTSAVNMSASPAHKVKRDTRATVDTHPCHPNMVISTCFVADPLRSVRQGTRSGEGAARVTRLYICCTAG